MNYSQQHALVLVTITGRARLARCFAEEIYNTVLLHYLILKFGRAKDEGGKTTITNKQTVRMIQTERNIKSMFPGARDIAQLIRELEALRP